MLQLLIVAVLFLAAYRASLHRNRWPDSALAASSASYSLVKCVGLRPCHRRI
jgi:hypothetical protein